MGSANVIIPMGSQGSYLKIPNMGVFVPSVNVDVVATTSIEYLPLVEG